jgi:O-Antigen ligase
MIQTQTYPGIALPAPRSSSHNLGIVLAVGLSISISAALWFGNKPQLLRVAIPALAAFVGILLYTTRPIAYVSYSLWVWFLAPFVRRVVDWHFGFFEPNFVLLAPLLVSGISVLTFFPSNRVAGTRVPKAFILCGLAILYGFSVAVLRHASEEAVFSLVNWLSPMLFGLHLYLNWPYYEQYRTAITRTFVLALLILGLYGIYQFFLPPSWDITWLDNVRADSFGRPEPMQIRVWSTMNSPGPFANAMMAGLLMLLVVRVPLRLPASIAGYLALLLSVVRTAWLSWGVGLVWILKSAKPRVMFRLVLFAALLVICVLPLASDPRLASVIGDRFNTFTDLGHDESFGARLQMYKILLQEAANTPFGLGLRNQEVLHDVALDSGILTLVFSLGWLGSGLFLTGVTSIFLQTGRSNAVTDEFYQAARAIVFAVLAQLIGGDVFVSITGAIFWIFAGMCLAADSYHRSLATITR